MCQISVGAGFLGITFESSKQVYPVERSTYNRIQVHFICDCRLIKSGGYVYAVVFLIIRAVCQN